MNPDSLEETNTIPACKGSTIRTELSLEVPAKSVSERAVGLLVESGPLQSTGVLEVFNPRAMARERLE